LIPEQLADMLTCYTRWRPSGRHSNSSTYQIADKQSRRKPSRRHIKSPTNQLVEIFQHQRLWCTVDWWI